MSQLIDRFITKVHLIGHNAWVVAFFGLALLATGSIILVTDDDIVRYVCLVLFCFLVGAGLFTIVVITIRESKVNPHIPYTRPDLQEVIDAMNKQKDNTEKWGGQK